MPVITDPNKRIALTKSTLLQLLQGMKANIMEDVEEILAAYEPTNPPVDPGTPGTGSGLTAEQEAKLDNLASDANATYATKEEVASLTGVDLDGYVTKTDYNIDYNIHQTAIDGITTQLTDEIVPHLTNAEVHITAAERVVLQQLEDRLTAINDAITALTTTSSNADSDIIVSIGAIEDQLSAVGESLTATDTSIETIGGRMDTLTTSLTDHETANATSFSELDSRVEAAEATILATTNDLTAHTSDITIHLSAQDAQKLLNLAADANATYATKQEVAGKTRVFRYADIAARDADTTALDVANLGCTCWVSDASGDTENIPPGFTGAAQYLVYSEDGEPPVSWEFLFSADGGSPVELTWDALENKPQSTVVSIDGAVDMAHVHPNDYTVDGLGEENGKLTYNNVLVAEHDHQHTNAETIDALGTEDGKLTFNGEPIATESENDHSHDNSDTIDNLGTDANGKLTLNGEVVNYHQNELVLEALGTNENGELTLNGVKVNQPGEIPSEPGTGSGSDHAHSNKSILDRLGESVNGTLTYKGLVVDTPSQVAPPPTPDHTHLNFGLLNSLSLNSQNKLTVAGNQVDTDTKFNGDMDNKNITNLLDPVGNLDATNKQYVDSEIMSKATESQQYASTIAASKANEALTAANEYTQSMMNTDYIAYTDNSVGAAVTQLTADYMAYVDTQLAGIGSILDEINGVVI